MGVMRQTDLSALDDRIQELVTYARERDGEDRTALYRNLVDLFLTGKAPVKEPTRNQLLDVIEALLPHVDQDTRRTVADLLLNITQPPMDLIMRLVTDDTPIVADLLREAPFSEEQVIELIESSSRAHHQELATRNDLSANVWIALARAAPAIKNVRIESEALWDKTLGKAESPFTGATVTELHPKPIDVSKFKANPNLISTPDDPAPQAEEPPTQADEIEKLLMAKLEQAETQVKSNSKIRILSDEESSMGTVSKVDQPAGIKLFTADQADTSEKSDEISAEMSGPFKTTPTFTSDNGAEYTAPTNWHWITGRSNEIVKSMGCPIDKNLLGVDIMMLLGLGEKPNHPVSKAIYRRGSIHDAPIYLSGMERGKRYWTLEAKPTFSSGGGTFEGYEGTMTTVAADADTQTSQELPNTLTKPAYSAIEPTPKPMSPDLEMPVTNEQEIVIQKVDSMTKEDPFDAIRSMVENATREAVEGLSGDLAEAVHKSEAKTRPEPIAITQSETTTHQDTRQNNMASTLTMLANTLGEIKTAGDAGDKHSLRLHTEIAEACVRSLRQQSIEEQITTTDTIFL